MVLTLHISLAIISVVVAIYAIVRPSRLSISLINFFGASALLSGLVQVIFSPASIGRSCVAGILFLGFCVVASKIAKTRLLF